MPAESSVRIRDFVPERDLEACATMMAASEPWITLRRDRERCAQILSDPTRERFVAEEQGDLAGFLILNMKGAFVGYIQTVCVAPDRRGKGIGTLLVRFAEERSFQESPNVFLCVSSFNAAARRLYERLGYGVVGELSDYGISGQSEILMRKSIGPWHDFLRRGRAGS